MLVSRERKFLLASLVVGATGIILAMSADEGSLLAQRVKTGLSIGLCAVAVILVGIYFAIRIKSLFFPIVLGATTGVFPSLSFALLHLLPLRFAERAESLVLASISEVILLPLIIMLRGTDLFVNIYSSHTSWANTMSSWIIITVLSGAFWSLMAASTYAILLHLRDRIRW